MAGRNSCAEARIGPTNTPKRKTMPATTATRRALSERHVRMVLFISSGILAAPKRVARLGMVRKSLTALVVLSLAAPAAAHEVWIEPLVFRAVPSERIAAHIKNGQYFKGNQFPYIPAETVMAGIVDAKGKRPLTGAAGDEPAIDEKVRTPGLQVLFYESVPERLVFAEAGKFRDYLFEKGLDHIWRSHQARGLGETGFTEVYTRCAKALVLRGSGKKADRQDAPSGMPLEWVAKADPFALSPGANAVLPVQLLWRGKPLAQAQATIFRRDSTDAVQTVKLHTDANGIVLVPVVSNGSYLIDSVHMIPSTAEPDVPWRSYWASLTFRIGPD
ncbi:MAG: DUF4198 domain-containing protein [Alphaproteobacteria bacterium]|nr:DUF4198 domain-containing protein [Alphaproteobacteria bacterium]